jgi:sigma-B regulation protein RsbU (phosphoserine phosphatase)
MQSLLVVVEAHQNKEDTLPLVIARRNPLSETGKWNSENLLLHFDPNFENEKKALFHGLQYAKDGYVSMPFMDEVSVWAYSKAETGLEGLGILNILPEREALYRIISHRGRLSRWLSLDSLLIVSAVVVMMVIIAAYRSRPMLAPFLSLVSAFERLSVGDFSTKLNFKTRDERQMVADAFNNMTLQLEDGMRMRQGLEVAKEVQHNFFPEIDPSISDLDIGVEISYCEETGGDYVDVLYGKGGKVCIVVGDVTGHGVGAALLMATVRALVRGKYEVISNLSQVITSVNFKLTADMRDSGRFVTLFIIEIDPTSQNMRWVRAGHDPAWLLRNADSSIISLSGQGVALGVVNDLVYSENYRDQMESGDVILIGTDGIWETSSPDGSEFGKHNLERILLENSTRTASEICKSVIDAVNSFRGTQHQEDDVSVAVIKIP